MGELFYVMNMDGRQSGQANDSASMVKRAKEKATYTLKLFR